MAGPGNHQIVDRNLPGFAMQLELESIS